MQAVIKLNKLGSGALLSVILRKYTCKRNMQSPRLKTRGRKPCEN